MNNRRYRCGLDGRKGVVLILVLWVLVLLTAIATEFSHAMRSETNMTRNSLDSTKAYFVARSGVYLALYEVLRDQLAPLRNDGGDGLQESIWRVNTDIPELPLAGGMVKIRLENESGKINLNTATEDILGMLLTGLNVHDEEQSIIVDSILDWRDEDDFHRPNGAESSYYQSLPRPYVCKNADFDSADELLLVKGVTPELFYGGLQQAIAVYPYQRRELGARRIIRNRMVSNMESRININAAPPGLLSLLPGMTPDLVAQIIEYRKTKDFATLLEVQEVIGPGTYSTILPFIKIESSPYYRIQALGRVPGGAAKQGVEMLVKIDPQISRNYRIMEWKDGMYQIFRKRTFCMFFQDSIGVEWSAREIAVVHLKASFSGVRLLNHAIFPIEEGDVSSQNGSNSQIVDFIKRCRSVSDYVFLSIPAESTIIRQIELPLAVKENLRETLQYELERFMPLNADDVYFDHQIVSENSETNRLKVLIAVTKHTEITRHLEMLGPYAKNVCGIEPAPAAWANYFFDIIQDPVYALIQFDQWQIRICGITNGHPMFVRTLARTPERQNLADLILGSLNPLKAVTEPDQPALTKVYFFGSDIPVSLVPDLNARTDFDFRLLDLSSQKVTDPRLFGAFGAALSGLRRQSFQMNMLPEGLRKRASRLSRYLAVGLVVLAILTGIAYAGSHFLQQRSRLQDLDRQIEEYSAEIAGLERIQSETQSIQKQIEFLNQIQISKMTLLDILKDLTEIIPPTAWVRNINITENKVEIEGYADAASELIPLLDASPKFTEVGFLSAITKTRDGKDTFRIGFKLRGIGQPTKG